MEVQRLPEREAQIASMVEKGGPTPDLESFRRGVYAHLGTLVLGVLGGVLLLLGKLGFWAAGLVVLAGAGPTLVGGQVWLSSGLLVLVGFLAAFTPPRPVEPPGYPRPE